MSRNVTFIVVLVTLVLFLFLGITLGKQSAIPLSAEAYAVCAVSMGDVIESGQGEVYNYEDVAVAEESSFYYLAYYSVEGDELASPDLNPVPASVSSEYTDIAVQTQAWDIFTKLIPTQDRQMVAQFNVFTDGFENTLAAVDQTQEDLSQWVLEVDVADLEDKDSLMFTIIHEYAHLLTLNDSQVTPDAELVQASYEDEMKYFEMQDEKIAACPNYFTGTGCSHADSYINTFYTRFWTDINDEWRKIDALQYGTDDDVPYYNALYAFYKAHQDQFVDDYSVTHPAEDIAEAFTYFVFSPKPVGNSIKEQKIAFFYEYPELIRLREDILNGACKLE